MRDKGIRYEAYRDEPDELRQDREAQHALIAVIGCCLVMLCLVVLASMWGVK